MFYAELSFIARVAANTVLALRNVNMNRAVNPFTLGCLISHRGICIGRVGLCITLVSRCGYIAAGYLTEICGWVLNKFCANLCIIFARSAKVARTYLVKKRKTRQSGNRLIVSAEDTATSLLLISNIRCNFCVRRGRASGKISQTKFLRKTQRTATPWILRNAVCIRHASFRRPISNGTRLHPVHPVYEHGREPRYKRNIRASPARIRRSLFPRQIYLACLEFEDAPPTSSKRTGDFGFTTRMYGSLCLLVPSIYHRPGLVREGHVHLHSEKYCHREKNGKRAQTLPHAFMSPFPVDSMGLLDFSSTRCTFVINKKRNEGEEIYM